MPHSRIPRRRRCVGAFALAALASLALHAGCGGEEKPRAQNRPEDVAKAFVEALKSDSLEPLEPHLMTAAEKQAITKLDSTDLEQAERDRWRSYIDRQHERLALDWDSLAIVSTKSMLDAFGQGARVRVELESADGPLTLDVKVAKVGRRFVFESVKFVESAKQAAPADEPEED